VYMKKGVEMETVEPRASWEMDSAIHFDRWSIVFIVERLFTKSK
jgi:hypothetical protein